MPLTVPTPPPRGEGARRQLSLFGVEASNASPVDLAGLLAGPGRVSRMGGTARVSVTVDAAWRVHVLVAELAARGLETSWERRARVTGDGVEEPDGFEVRTAYSVLLAPLAAAWSRGPVPRFFHLNGPRLRLWLACAGTLDARTCTLGLTAQTAAWDTVGAALARAGLPATLVEGGPALRITGRRRLARLAELVGDPPAAAPAECWPTTAT